MLAHTSLSSNFLSLICQYNSNKFVPTVWLLQVQADPLCQLRHTLGQGDKCPLTVKRPPVCRIPLHHSMEAADALHQCKGTWVGLGCFMSGFIKKGRLSSHFMEQIMAHKLVRMTGIYKAQICTPVVFSPSKADVTCLPKRMWLA